MGIQARDEVRFLIPRISIMESFITVGKEFVMLRGCVSWIKAAQDYFSNGEHARPVFVPEFKALSAQDKIELHAMLADAGYDLEPIKVKSE